MQIKKAIKRKKFKSSSFKIFILKLFSRRDKEFLIRDLITSLSLCHNVMPIIKEGQMTAFQGSSPDEVALVEV